VKIGHEVQYLFKERVYTKLAQDISEGGLRVRDTESIPLNVLLRLIIPLPQRDSDRFSLCMLKGRPIWRENGWMGIQFQEPSRGVLIWIREFIERREDRPVPFVDGASGPPMM
jgi:hypothetical protein